MPPAIRVENLSKEYRIGARSAENYRTLRESLVDAVTRPWRRLWNGYHGIRGKNGHDNTFWALKDVSFEVEPGEVVGIIGRNGAGKSTLLKILSQIVEPTSGRAEVRGRMGSLLEIGTGFHPELTGRENIYLNGSILGMSRKEINQTFDQIVAFSEIEQFLDTPVKRYSSGMYVRLAFAVAAHLQPEILVVDEVLSVGDVQFQKKCLGRMEEVRQEGRTVFFVSHNMTAINSLCSKGIWLDKGSVKMMGDAATIVERYLACRDQQHETGNMPVDLRSRIRAPQFEKKVKFVEIELRNEQGDVTYTFGVGEPITIILTMESQVFYDHFIAGLSVRTPEGIVLFTSASDDQGNSTAIRPGTFKMSCRMAPNYLKPGMFYLQIGNELGTTQDFLEEATSFEIQPTKSWSNSAKYNLPGCVHFSYDWHHDG